MVEVCASDSLIWLKVLTSCRHCAFCLWTLSSQGVLVPAAPQLPPQVYRADHWGLLLCLRVLLCPDKGDATHSKGTCYCPHTVKVVYLEEHFTPTESAVWILLVATSSSSSSRVELDPWRRGKGGPRTGSITLLWTTTVSFEGTQIRRWHEEPEQCVLARILFKAVRIIHLNLTKFYQL